MRASSVPAMLMDGGAGESLERQLRRLQRLQAGLVARGAH
jgi:hypothetical protein